jgi:hypothetical protein
MATRQIAFEVPDELFDESAARLAAAGVEDAAELLEAALQAGAIDTLETIGGAGPVPTALNDLRAARLLELCKLRKEILPDEVVGVVFRVMPTTAASITRRMQATYESALQESLDAHMKAAGKLSSPKKEEDEDPKHRVTFSTAAAFGHATKKIAAAGLAGEVSADRPKRSLEFPQTVEVTRGSSTQKVRIARDVLGIQ